MVENIVITFLRIRVNRGPGFGCIPRWYNRRRREEGHIHRRIRSGGNRRNIGRRVAKLNDRRGGGVHGRIVIHEQGWKEEK